MKIDFFKTITFFNFKFSFWLAYVALSVLLLILGIVANRLIYGETLPYDKSEPEYLESKNGMTWLTNGPSELSYALAGGFFTLLIGFGIYYLAYKTNELKSFSRLDKIFMLISMSTSAMIVTVWTRLFKVIIAIAFLGGVLLWTVVTIYKSLL